MEDRVPHSASQSSFYSSSTPATASAAAASGPGSGAGHGSGSGSGSGAGKSHAAPPSYSSATSSNTTTSVDNASSGVCSIVDSEVFYYRCIVASSLYLCSLLCIIIFPHASSLFVSLYHSQTWRGALAGAAAGYVLARVVDSISQPSVSSTTTTTTPTSAPFGYPGTYPTYAQPPTSSYTAMPSASNYRYVVHCCSSLPCTAAAGSCPGALTRLLTCIAVLHLNCLTYPPPFFFHMLFSWHPHSSVVSSCSSVDDDSNDDDDGVVVAGHARRR